MSPSNHQMEEGDAAIVTRVRDGELEAFRILVERHGRALYAVAHRMMGNGDKLFSVAKPIPSWCYAVRRFSSSVSSSDDPRALAFFEEILSR